jgi:translation initiation factor IF-3
VPVPRRFDRRPPERDPTRINERIRVPEVRLIGDDGSQIGVIKTDEALKIARERDLDLVEVAPEARPPVCRVLDYSKYKYEQEQKQKQARKHQQQITVREIKFRPKIAQHDYDTKKGHVERFLRHQDKVKVTIMFRGREVTHPERGEMILTRLADELAELAVVEQRPIQDGRNMTMMLAPAKAASESKPASDAKADSASKPAEAEASGSDGGGGNSKPDEAAAKPEEADAKKPEEADAKKPEEADAKKPEEADVKPEEADAKPAEEAAGEAKPAKAAAAGAKPKG